MSNSKGKASASRPTSRSPRINSKGSASLRDVSNSEEKRKIVGQYMFGKTIGEGTFGKVRLAIHIPTGEKVAIKILEKNRIKEQADVRRVNREIKILKKSKHSNIIQLYEVLDTQNTIYLIMECAEGGEMFDFIVAQKHVPEIQACKFFHQIVDGVEVLHNNDITHRDLKPENLLLKASPSGWLIKVVDFGLSNTHEGGKLLSTACGSPCYAAPEMIAGKKYYGPLADLWSLGVILFALVCGYLPFEDPNTSLLYKKILAGDYSSPKWISGDVKDLIRKILETDPRKRFTIKDIRKHSWYNIVSENDIPKEHITVSESEETKSEVLQAINAAGLDTQAVLDGVASHACNSLTAMYYLLEQKYKTLRMKNKIRSSSMNIIPLQNDESNVSNTSKKTSTTHPESSTENVVAVADLVPTKNNQNNSHKQPEDPVIINKPNKSNNNNSVAPNNNANATQAQKLNSLINTTKLQSNVNNSSNAQTPYLQAPNLLQQHMRNHQQHQQQQLQQQQQNDNNNDSENDQNYTNNSQRNVNNINLENLQISDSSKYPQQSQQKNIPEKLKVSPLKTTEMVMPKLNLRNVYVANNNNNSAVPSPISNHKIVNNRIENVSVKLVSQTARQQQQNQDSASLRRSIQPQQQQPQSARAAPNNINVNEILSFKQPSTDERPNTRRSHTRGSRDDGSHTGAPPGEGLIPEVPLDGAILTDKNAAASVSPRDIKTGSILIDKNNNLVTNNNISNNNNNINNNHNNSNNSTNNNSLRNPKNGGLTPRQQQLLSLPISSLMLNSENLTYDNNPVSARSNNTNNGINNLASPAKNNVNLKIENRIINSTTSKVNNNNNNGNNVNNSAQPPENLTRSSFSRSVNTSGRRVVKAIDKKFDNTADPTNNSNNNNNNNNNNSISGNKGALISKVQFKNESENSSKVTSFKSAQSGNNNNENSTSIHTPRSLALKNKLAQQATILM